MCPLGESKLGRHACPATRTAEVARRSGSIAIYGGILASKLRIQRGDAPDDPATWPKLAKVQSSEVKKFW
jgi:hypothetical protein